MTVLTVHSLPVMSADTIRMTVELRCTEPDDYCESGFRQWSVVLPLEAAAQLGAKLMQAGLELETDRP